MYYDLGQVHSNLGEFQYRFVMQKFRFSVPPLLPRFPSSNVISSCSWLCTVWWRRSLKSPHKVENASELQLTSISDQYLLYVFMDSWVYNGAPQPCFSSCMVDYTLMTDQMTTRAVEPHSPGWARVPLSSFFPQISINFSSNFIYFLPHFGPPGGRVAHPGRPWLRHWWRPFLFSILYGLCTRRLNLLPIFKQGRTSSDFNEISPNIKTGTDFLQLFVMKFVYFLHLTPYLISQ